MRFFTVLLTVAGLANVSLAAPKSDNLVEELISLIEKGFKFLAHDYSSINVDGLFGLRIGQGQLRQTIEECRDRSCNPEVLAKVVSLEAALEDTCNKALPYVLQTDPAYYNRFEPTITKPFELEYRPTEFDMGPTHIGGKSDYNEDYGDMCYSRMMGSFLENGVPVPKCNVTSECWEYMTQRETSQYFITHQLLYFIVIDHVGCQEDVERQIKGDNLHNIHTRFCKNIYEESKQLSEGGYVDAFHQDLFLEQTLLCGILGFEDFMRPDWMKMVMSWPDRLHGCFKLNVPDSIAALVQFDSLDGDLRNLRGEKRETSEEEESSNSWTMRKTLREKVMAGGCLSHTSGLGFGTLCTYLRYLVRYA